MEGEDTLWLGPCPHSLTWWYLRHTIPTQNISSSSSAASVVLAKPTGYDTFFKARHFETNLDGSFVVNFNGIPADLQKQQQEQIRIENAREHYITFWQNMLYFFEDETSDF